VVAVDQPFRVDQFDLATVVTVEAVRVDREETHLLPVKPILVAVAVVAAVVGPLTTIRLDVTAGQESSSSLTASPDL